MVAKFWVAVLVMNTGVVRRQLRLPNDWLASGFPRWDLQLVSSPALRLNLANGYRL